MFLPKHGGLLVNQATRRHIPQKCNLQKKKKAIQVLKRQETEALIFSRYKSKNQRQTEIMMMMMMMIKKKQKSLFFCKV
jgi:Na+-translocating ferredoxin:NAD+ oxidoreductase RnfG subunit